MILTQYSAPAAAAPASPEGDALTRVCYRAIDSRYAFATVEYARNATTIEDRDPQVALPAQSARYVCIESQDSGAYESRHRVLMIVAFQVPAARAEEVERWYREEHGPMLLRAPGWLRMRRYELLKGAGGPLWTHLALHELRDVAVLDSAERALARSTVWRAQLQQESWFAGAGRFVYEVMPC